MYDFLVYIINKNSLFLSFFLVIRSFLKGKNWEILSAIIIKTKQRNMSIEKALVSIIIPIYNAESFLEQCIDSILQQTYNNFVSFQF